MNIPDNIVEQAASESFGPDWDNAHPEDQRYHRNEVRKILNAAAPFIAAQALRDAGKDLDARAGEKHAEPVVHGIMRAESTRLHNRAAELDPS